MDKKEKGEHVNDRDLKKHKLDVYAIRSPRGIPNSLSAELKKNV